MQISIIVLVDVVATLTEKSIDNNAYVIDNTQGFARESDQDAFPVTRVGGVCHADGSQAEEVVLNWIVMSIASLPTTLPKGYAYRKSDALLLNALRNANEVKKRSDAVPMASLPVFQKSDGGVLMAETLLLDAAGEAIADQDIDAAAYVPLQVNSVYGPAESDKVIYPALYGSPDLKTGGWYWSASVDTAKEGRHLYHMDVVLHRPEGGVWVPETYTITASVEVSRSLKVNGFTGGLGLPPLPLHVGMAMPVGDVI